MATDIVFDKGGEDAIELMASRVGMTGRLRLSLAQGAGPPADGRVGDLVMTVEDGHNENLGLRWSTTRLWLCTPPEGDIHVVVDGAVFWREVQLGPVVPGP